MSVDPTISFITPGGDPSLAQQMAHAQFQQAMAQALLREGAQNINPASAQINGVAYRVSPLEGLAHMLETYVGARGLNEGMQTQTGLYQQMANQMAGTDQGAAQPQSDNQAAMQPLMQGNVSTDQAPTPVNGGSAMMNTQALAQALDSQGASSQAQQTLPTQTMQPSANHIAPLQPGGALNPMGMNAYAAWRSYATDPAAYMKSINDFYAPTNDMKNAHAAEGGDPILMAQAIKNSSNNVGAGQTVLNPLTGSTFTAPDKGVAYQWGPNGPQATEIPGYGPAAANVSYQSGYGADRAKLDNELATIQLSNGSTTQGPAGQLAGPPPAWLHAAGQVSAPKPPASGFGPQVVGGASWQLGQQPQPPAFNMSQSPNDQAAIGDQAKQGAAIYNNLQNIATNYPVIRSALLEMQNLAQGGSKTGPGQQSLASVKSILGLPEQASNLAMINKLNSYLGSVSPLPVNTNAALDNALHSNPNGEVPNQAIVQAANFLRSGFDRGMGIYNSLNAGRSGPMTADQLATVGQRMSQMNSYDPQAFTFAHELNQAQKNGTMQQFLQQAQRFYGPQFPAIMSQAQELDTQYHVLGQ